MAKFFDHKVFNEEAFGKYMGQVPNIVETKLLKSGVLERDTRLEKLLSEQTGSHFGTLPIFDRLNGTYVNYDGSTNITDNAQRTFNQSFIALGRAASFKERDFADDLTGETFMQYIAGQINEYSGE